MTSNALHIWYTFRRTALRSFVIRIKFLLRNVYIGEATRIPGNGTLDFHANSSVQRMGVINARAGAEIRIGSRSRIGAFSVISAAKSVEIGQDVLIADRVFISDHNHEIGDPFVPVIHQGISASRPVVIGDGCWLGINVSIMPGVTLGSHCIVGTGSVVTQSFPSHSVIGGVPAKLLKSRIFSEN